MAQQIHNLSPARTYANVKTLKQALSKIPAIEEDNELRYHIAWTEQGRCYPMFIGFRAVEKQLFMMGFVTVA